MNTFAVLLLALVGAAAIFTRSFGRIRSGSRANEPLLPTAALRSIPIVIDEIARGLGLPRAAGMFGSAPRIEGVLDGIEVSIRPDDFDLAIQAHGPSIDRSWVLRRKSYGGTVGITIGDPAFDETVFVNGEPAKVRAAFDEPLRALARHLASLGLALQHGRFTMHRRGPNVDVQAVCDTVRQIVRLANALSGSGDPVPPLAALASGDPAAGVRWRCLLLLAPFSGRAEARAALDPAATDPDGMVRLAAAVIGRRVSEAADLLLYDTIDADERAECAALLVRFLDASRDSREVERLVTMTPKAVRLVVLREIVERPSLARWPLVARALSSVDAESRKSAVEAIAAIRDPDATAVLLPRLADANEEVVHAAIWALAGIGNTSAVEPLKRLGSSKAFREAALDAVERIKARAKGADAGQLSIAAPGREGALSIPVAGGELSLRGKRS